jgi:hypothetical protein
MGVEFVLRPYSRRCTCESYGPRNEREKKEKTTPRAKMKGMLLYHHTVIYHPQREVFPLSLQAIPVYIYIERIGRKKVLFFFSASSSSSHPFFLSPLPFFLQFFKDISFLFKWPRLFNFKHKHNCGSKNRKKKENGYRGQSRDLKKMFDRFLGLYSIRTGIMGRDGE